MFLVSLAEYLSIKYRQLAEQYAQIALGQADAAAIDAEELNFLAEASVFVHRGLRPFSVTSHNRPPVVGLPQLKAELVRRTRASATPFAEEHSGEADTEHIPTEGDADMLPSAAFRSIMPLPHVCKLDKYKNTKMCKPASS